MKTRTLCSAALLALVSSAVLLPVGASAAKVETPVPVTGTGSVTYEQGNEQPIVNEPGKDGEDTEIDEPGRPENWNPLMMIAASPLDFKTQKIGSFVEDPEYYASNFTTTKTASGEEVTMENFVKFRDIRGSKNHNFVVSAQLTKQFTAVDDAELVLKGAKLDFANAELITTEANEGNKPNVESAETTLQTAFTLEPNEAGTGAGASVEVLSNTGQKGFGVFDIKFGDMAVAGSEVGKTQSEESIKLTVPASNQLTANTYQSEITWTIADLPETAPEA